MKRKSLAIILVAIFALSTTAFAAKPISLWINGKEVKPAVAPQMINNTTMVPLRVISEALGADVKWDQKQQRVTVTAPQQPVQQAGLTLEQLNKIGESVGIIYAYNGDQYISQGSGFIVDGVLVTNWHVLEGATQFVVAFGNKEATLRVADAVFKNETVDLIGFKLAGYPSLKLNTSEPMNKDKVYALGHPARKFTITEGMFVSSSGNGTRWMHSAKTDPGASGGIVINAKGEVIGVSVEALEGGYSNYAVQAKVLKQELAKVK
ncbi:hypothetical protein DNH61_11820 [Paenibacillus sambharensis]|uniref:Copper amine oxidase-like N-terminal domain-containing protein n=1 Tax=Paenibacillus sambharensis TaxID=1803190 RepID=A0A2W1LTX7_9BACL|nr:trypsin-like peptidase domain-containing protein [Paenibacillus sambharensis]PZD95241.1 hypothetical protein DNH61_11820 [Paenibacillus sambharensis]